MQTACDFNFFTELDCIFFSLIQAPLTHPSYSLALRVLSYYIMLFPSLDVVSAYPLFVITMVNSIYIAIFGKDSAQANKSWTSLIVLLLMKFTLALLPILVAMAVSNLVTILKYSGFFSFFISILMPILLQLRSQWVCWKVFKNATEPKHELEETSLSNGAQRDSENRSLLIRSSSQVNPSALYMTPYSNIFSYWPAVVAIGGVGVVMFLLAVAGFSIQKN